MKPMPQVKVSTIILIDALYNADLEELGDIRQLFFMELGNLQKARLQEQQKLDAVIEPNEHERACSKKINLLTKLCEAKIQARVLDKEDLHLTPETYLELTHLKLIKSYDAPKTYYQIVAINPDELPVSDNAINDLEHAKTKTHELEAKVKGAIKDAD